MTAQLVEEGKYFKFLFSSKKILAFLTVGEEKGPGLFLLVGPSELVAEMGPQ